MATARVQRLRTPVPLVAFLSVCLGGGVAATVPTGCSRDARAEAEAHADAPLGAATTDPRPTLAPMIKKVAPAVVSIRATRSGGLPFGFAGGQAREGTGSGFVLEPDGVVITNHHVIADAESLEVELADGRTFAAKVLGSDPATDLAVLSLGGASGLASVELGKSTSLEVGDWVVAIGSPMGLRHSASVGIVSAYGRGSLGLYPDSFIDFLQTDADIAPGSSGGPLFDLHGQVVGITTAVGAGGPGFAIPIDQAKRVIAELRESGEIVRGWLGAASDPSGGRQRAVIGQVFEATPAARAGLQAGDVVSSVDGTAISNFDDFRSKIADLPPGQAVVLEIERAGNSLEVSVVLGARPDQHKLRTLSRIGASVPRTTAPPRDRTRLPTLPGVGRDSGPRLGIQAKPHPRGVEVVEVDPGSVASDLELAPGDVVTRINGVPARHPDDIRAALVASPNTVDVLFLRGDVEHQASLERS